MQGRRWYAVLLALLAEGIGTLVLVIDPGTGGIERSITTVFAFVFFVGYPALPLATYLDLRRLRGTVPWDPSASRWVAATLVPFAAVGVGVAYLIRRRAACRATVPGDGWYWGVVAGVGIWTAAFAIEIALDIVMLPELFDLVFGPLVLLGFCGVPALVYLDIAHARGYLDWNANSAIWPVGAAIPYVGALVCLAYLIRRRQMSGERRTAPRLADPGAPEEAQPASPWFRATIGLFLVYLGLAFVGGILAGPDVSDVALELLALIVWVPVGPFFAAGVYGDARWRRRHDRPVGDHWYLYLSAVVIPAAAFWYLLRRVTREPDSSQEGVTTWTEND